MKSLRSRIEIWLYKRLRSLVLQEKRILSGKGALMQRPKEVIVSFRRIVVGVMVVAALSGIGGYWIGHTQEPVPTNPAVHSISAPIPSGPPQDPPRESTPSLN